MGWAYAGWERTRTAAYKEVEIQRKIRRNPKAKFKVVKVDSSNYSIFRKT